MKSLPSVPTHGFLRVATAAPELRVADVAFNTAKIREAMQVAADRGASIVVFPFFLATSM